jgi:hypothetical protein
MGAMVWDVLCRLTEKGVVLGMLSFTRWELSAGSKFPEQPGSNSLPKYGKEPEEFPLRGTTVIHVRR